MSDTTKKSSRRDVLKTIGGVLGGASLLGHGTARGQALGSMPNGYNFYRILRADQGGRFGPDLNPLGDMTGSVMVASPPAGAAIEYASPLGGAGRGHVYVHGTQGSVFGRNPATGVFQVVINFGPTPPVVERVNMIANVGNFMRVDGVQFDVGQIGTGACNAQGEYVTTIAPIESSDTVTEDNSPGVFLYRPNGLANGSWSRRIRFGDPVPDGSFYGGDFGDIALDNNENLLLAAATTKSPDDRVSGFAGSQALVATSISAPTTGRVVLQTGDLLPFGSGVVESVGLVDLAANQVFAAQVSARSLGTSVARSGTALVLGNTQGVPAEHKLVAASSELMSPGFASQRNITSGQTFFGPRVDRWQDVAFVTHDSTFETSLGSNAIETLGYYSRGSALQLEKTQMSASSTQVVALGAPCIDSAGLMYGTELLGDGRSRLFVSDGRNMQYVLRSGDRIPGIPGTLPAGELVLSEILFGQHSTQVDAFGRLAFTAEFLLDATRPPEEQNPANVITALVIGIPK
jgi:hypothetical protein